MDWITETPVVFTPMGTFEHPDLPSAWSEYTSTAEINGWLQAQQITKYVQVDLLAALRQNTSISEHQISVLMAKYEQFGDLSGFPLIKPAGDGWFLLAVYDSEEGPFSWWVTRTAATQPSNAEQMGQNAPPRPHLTEHQLKQVALALVNQLQSEPVDKDQAADDICAEYFFGMNGYELAKSLDDNHGWAITSDMIEIFDSFNYMVSDAQDQLEREWVNQYGIKAPLAVGQRVTLLRKHGAAAGTISDVDYDGRACYLIEPDGVASQNTKLVVRYEDVIAPEDEA